MTGEIDCAENFGGEFLGLEAECAGTVCVGACCLSDKSCTETGLGLCGEMGGTFQGRGTVCENCPAAMPTSFTYQGQLKREGAPLNGFIDARFSLWLSPTGDDPASQIGPTFTQNSIEVVNGLFHVELDFGQDAFNGNARWLQVEVHDHDDAPGTFTTLSPRQPLTPTPYALQTRGIVVLENGDVGIGTNTPFAKVHVKTPGEGLHIEGPVVGPENSAWVGFYDANHTLIGYVGDGSGSDSSVYLASYTGDVHLYTNAGAVITAKANGRVGIGTMSPANRLSVAGGGADFAGNVGIGTTTPAERLDLGGGNIAMGYEIVEANSTGDSAAATCPSGKRVIGGGCVCGLEKLQGSAPDPGGAHWVCFCDDSGTSAFAICANIR